jgi:ribosome biogenesis GTPase
MTAIAGLDVFGWTDELSLAHASHAALGREPARVVAEDRGSYQLAAAAGEMRAAISGRYRFEAGDHPVAYPAVGDWVAVEAGMIDETVIHALLPRRTALVRQAAGRRTEAQVVGANLDVVFVVASLNADLNLRRLERYVAAAWESGAEPVVLLSKAELGEDIETIARDVERVSAGASVVVVSSFDGRGVDEVEARIGAGRTAAFVGSSGVGKSTLLNRLAGEERATVRDVREDDGRGRHTATRRQLHLLPSGALVLDTPGMREHSLWDADGLEREFGEIDELASAWQVRRLRPCRRTRVRGRFGHRRRNAFGRSPRKLAEARARGSSSRASCRRARPQRRAPEVEADREVGLAAHGHEVRLRRLAITSTSRFPSDACTNRPTRRTMSGS